MNIDHLKHAIDEPDLSETHYELVEFLGSGGMGSVYVVNDKNLSRHVALKVLRLPDPSGQFTDRMIREAKIVAQLEHPGIVPIHDIGILPDGRPFYVSKLINGKTLDQYAKSAATISERLLVFQKVCEAVAFAHSRSVIHRDLKPQNIIVGMFGEVLVIDWGIAKVASVFDEITEPRLLSVHSRAKSDTPEQGLQTLPESSFIVPRSSLKTSSGSIIGTHGYMSPEQQQGDNQNVDERSDIYALGATLRELLLAQAEEQSLPKTLRAIYNKALSLQPAHRYPSATDFAADIARFIDNKPVSAYPENLFEKIARWVTINWFVVMLIAAYIVIRIFIYFIT